MSAKKVICGFSVDISSKEKYSFSAKEEEEENVKSAFHLKEITSFFLLRTYSVSLFFIPFLLSLSQVARIGCGN